MSTHWQRVILLTVVRNLGWYYGNISEKYCRNTNPGNASKKDVMKKHILYEEIKQNYEFVALAVETLGPWVDETKTLIKNIG